MWIYNTTLLNQDPFLFNITFSKHLDVASIPYFKTSPRLKIRSKFVNHKKNQNFAFNKCMILRTKFLMLEFFRFKDAHLQFRASIAFKYFPWYIMYYVSLCLISININCKKRSLWVKKDIIENETINYFSQIYFQIYKYKFCNFYLI